MKIVIEIYKNQSIFYDDEHDKFTCDISVEDNFRSTKRQSLKDVRKEIDQFIKINVDFKPFKAFIKGEYNDYTAEVINVSGIRTDGKLIVKINNNRSDIYSAKDFDRLRVYVPEIEEQIKQHENEIQIAYKYHREEISKLIKTLNKVDLSRYENILDK